jgi:hypothetical protein
MGAEYLSEIGSVWWASYTRRPASDSDTLDAGSNLWTYPSIVFDSEHPSNPQPPSTNWVSEAERRVVVWNGGRADEA